MSVTLMAFGRKGYAYATDALVASLRHYGYTGPIHVHATGRMRAMLLPSTLSGVTVHDLPEGYEASPGLAKVSLPRLLDYGPTLYLDVDAIALKDITPLIDALLKDERPYITHVVDKAAVSEARRPNYFIWATRERVVERHALAPDDVLFSPQTSWAWFRPGPDLNKLADTLAEVWVRWSLTDIDHKWGKSVPDELIYGIACTLSGLDPSWPTMPVHIGKGNAPMPAIVDAYYLLGMYGSGKNNSTVPRRFRDMYDAVVRQVIKGGGDRGLKSSSYLMRDKYVDHA